MFIQAASIEVIELKIGDTSKKHKTLRYAVPKLYTGNFPPIAFSSIVQRIQSKQKNGK